MRPSKRNELVRRALEVFDRDGFHATGMDALVAETGISKTTMFKHFRSKDDLILAVLRLRDENFGAWLHSYLAETAGDPGEQLLSVFDMLAEWFAQSSFNGCTFIKASAEFLDRDHPIAVQARDHKTVLLAELTGLAAGAGAVDPDKLGRQLMLLIEGAIVSAHIGYSAAPQDDARAAARILIDAALSRTRAGA